MSGPLSPASDTAYSALDARFLASKPSSPTLESIEEMLQLQAAVQAELSVQLTSLTTAMEKDLTIAGKCVAIQSPPPPKSRNSLLVSLQAAVDERQEANDRAEVLKTEGKHLREQFIEVKRRTSLVRDDVLRERQVTADKHKVLAKVDRLLSDAARLLSKVDDGGQRSVPAKVLRTARDSGVHLRLVEERGNA